jgi:hypothetical protein
MEHCSNLLKLVYGEATGKLSETEIWCLERMLASLVLAKIRQKQGEENTAHVELSKAQQFAHEMEQAAVAEHSHQGLDNVYQDAKKLAEVLAELDQKVQAVKDEAERLERISVHPMAVAPVDVASGSQEATSTRHISCYVSLPHYENEDTFYHQVLLPALRQILECHPFYWQVGYREDKLGYRHHKCSDCPAGKNASEGDRACWLKCADVCIADIEGWSPDVFADLGIIYAMRMMRTETPLSIILELNNADPDEQKRHDSIKQSMSYRLSDFGEVIPITHDFKIDSDSPDDYIKFVVGKVEQYLKNIFIDRGFLELNKKPREHYLSPVWIEEICSYKDKNMTKTISGTYITMEVFRDAVKGTTDSTTTKRIKAASDDLSSWGVTSGIIRSILDAVLSVLEGDRA